MTTLAKLPEETKTDDETEAPVATMQVSDPPSEKIPEDVPDKRDPFVSMIGRIGWRLLVNNNPFYYVSAVLVLWGLRQLYQASALDTWVLLGSLAVYALVLAITCILVIRLGRIWEDGRSLLLLLPVVFLAMAVSVDDLVLEAPGEAKQMLFAGLVSSALIGELVLMLSRIHLRAVYRISYLSLLSIFFLFPLFLFPALQAQDGNLLPVFLRLSLFPVVSCAPFLLLLIDMFRERPSRCNGTPWQWPWFPFALFALLALAIGGRTHFLAISFFPIRGDGNPFGLYQLLPLTTVIALLAIEIGIRNRKMASIWAGLGLPIIAAAISIVDLAGSGLNVEYAAKFAQAITSPLLLACASVVIVGVYAFWRKIEAGEWLVTGGLAVLIFTESHHVTSLTVPQTAPCLAFALATTALAYWRPGSWRAFLAGQTWLLFLCLLLQHTFFVQSMHGVLPIHIALGISLATAGRWEDGFARFLRVCNSSALLIAACVALIAGHDMVNSAPWVAWFLYPFLLLILCGIYALCTWTTETLAAGCLIGIGIAIRVCIAAFLAASSLSIPREAGVVILGVLALAVAIAVSTLKGILRICPDCFGFVAGFGKDVFPLLSRVLRRSVRLFAYSILGLFFGAFLLGSYMPHHGCREKAKWINCAGNLKQIGLALRMYSADNDGFFPPSLETLREQDYLTCLKVYQCPSVRQREDSRRDQESFLSDYWYIPGHHEDEPNTMKIPLAGDRGGNHTKFGNICFADGHVKGFAGPLWYQQAGLEHLPGDRKTDTAKAVTEKGTQK